MVVRGAPAIAIAAALSLAVEAYNLEGFAGTSSDAASFLAEKLDYLVSRYLSLLNLMLCLSFVDGIVILFCDYNLCCLNVALNFPGNREQKWIRNYSYSFHSLQPTNCCKSFRCCQKAKRSDLRGCFHCFRRQNCFPGIRLKMCFFFGSPC